MKLVDLLCKSCNHMWEDLIGDKDLIDCPACGSSKVERQFPAPKIGNQYKNQWNKQPYEGPKYYGPGTLRKRK